MGILPPPPPHTRCHPSHQHLGKQALPSGYTRHPTRPTYLAHLPAPSHPPTLPPFNYLQHFFGHSFSTYTVPLPSLDIEPCHFNIHDSPSLSQDKHTPHILYSTQAFHVHAPAAPPPYPQHHPAQHYLGRIASYRPTTYLRLVWAFTF